MQNPISDIKNVFTQDANANTPEGAIIRAGYKHLDATITLDANNTSANVNCFELTGPMKFDSIHATILTADTLTNCTNVYFDLWDGSASTVLTKVTGAALSGEGVGTFMVKTAIAATALSVMTTSAGNLLEVSGQKVSQEFHLMAKSGATNYIRFNYTTTDTPIDATIEVHVHYSSIDSGTITAV